MNEVEKGQPFVGLSGEFLNAILAEAGIRRDDILVTNVIAARPHANEMWRFFHSAPEAPASSKLRYLHPSKEILEGLDRLYSHIRAHPRKLVIAAGNYALWALSSHTGFNRPSEENGFRFTPNGIGVWRGSMTFMLSNPYTADVSGTPLLPIFHPSAIMRQYEVRNVTVHDLRARVPIARNSLWRPPVPPRFLAPPTFRQFRGQVRNWLARADFGEQIDIAEDIETSRGFITCIGFADSSDFAMCVPLIRPEGGVYHPYWSFEEEVELVRLIAHLNAHPNIRIVGQNFVYDMQYIDNEMLHVPRLDFDTMLAQHLLFPGTQKALWYLSSLYCEYHCFWKDDLKEWDAKTNFITNLEYNCVDVIKTWEVAQEQRKMIRHFGMERQWGERKYVNDLCFRMMRRGFLVNQDRIARLRKELLHQVLEIEKWLESMAPDSWCAGVTKSKTSKPWWRSTKKQRFLFGELLGIKLPKHRKTKKETMGKEAWPELTKKYPMFTRIFDAMETLRSAGVFSSTFLGAEIDRDGRARCSFNPTGTETFRLSSSKNAYGRGMNMQNIPEGDEE